MSDDAKGGDLSDNDNNDIREQSAAVPRKRNWVAFPGAREQAQHCRDGEAWYMGKEVLGSRLDEQC